MLLVYLMHPSFLESGAGNNSTFNATFIRSTPNIEKALVSPTASPAIGHRPKRYVVFIYAPANDLHSMPSLEPLVNM